MQDVGVRVSRIIVLDEGGNTINMVTDGSMYRVVL